MCSRYAHNKSCFRPSDTHALHTLLSPLLVPAWGCPNVLIIPACCINPFSITLWVCQIYKFFTVALPSVSHEKPPVVINKLN